CGDHLGWGYVDQPPLIPFLIHISRAVLGDSLRAIRFIPALASSLLVVQAALIARELGGKRYAMLLTAVTIVIAPQYLSNGSLLGTDCLEPNLWMGCAYFVILAIKRNDPRYWLWFGVIAGLGLEEKYSIALFGFGIVGLIAFLFWSPLKPYRVLGWSYLVCYTTLFLLHGKNYYLAPIYPMLLAAGAVVIESALSRTGAPARQRRLSWPKPVIVLILLAS